MFRRNRSAMSPQWEMRIETARPVHRAGVQAAAGRRMTAQPFLFMDDLWTMVRDGNRTALEIFNRHYSSRLAHLRKIDQFVGPGEKMVLLTPDAKALLAWRKERYRFDGQSGINCAVFRNEGAAGGQSSELIKAADRLADIRWPGERHFTFVHPRKIRSTNPGYCFLSAGWRKCGQTKGRLHILERLP